jgi:hypothetical protein
MERVDNPSELQNQMNFYATAMRAGWYEGTFEDFRDLIDPNKTLEDFEEIDGKYVRVKK